MKMSKYSEEQIAFALQQAENGMNVDASKQGSEFISKRLGRWAYDNGVTIDFSQPCKPTDNPYIESFNG